MEAFIKIIKKNDANVDINIKNSIPEQKKKSKYSKKVKIPKGAPPTSNEFSKFTPVKMSDAPAPDPWEDEEDEEYASVAPGTDDKITDSNDIYIRQDDEWKEMTKLDDDAEIIEEIYDEVEEQDDVSDVMSDHADEIYSESSAGDSDMEDVDTDEDALDFSWNVGSKKAKSNDNGFYSRSDSKISKTKTYGIPISFDDSDF